MELSPQVLTALDGMDAPAAVGVVLTGHSLGAAQSNIGAFELGMSGFPVTQVVSHQSDEGSRRSSFSAHRRSPSPAPRHQLTRAFLLAPASFWRAAYVISSLVHCFIDSLQFNFGQPRIGEGNYSAAFEALVVHGQDNATAATAAAAPSLDVAALHERDATKVLLSATTLRAIERALAHPENAHLTAGRASVASPADAESLLSSLREHARKSLSFVKKLHAARARLRAQPVLRLTLESVDRPRMESAARAEAVAALRAEEVSSGGEMRPALSKHQRALLAGLRFPLAAPAFPGAEVFRLIHNADIVPHLVSQ